MTLGVCATRFRAEMAGNRNGAISSPRAPQIGNIGKVSRDQMSEKEKDVDASLSRGLM